jgi:hypothetical protein
LSVGVTIDLAKVRTGDRVLDTTKSNPIDYYENFNRDFNYVYPFAKLRLNYQDRYFLTAGTTYQMDFYNTHLGTSANLRLDYFFESLKSNDGAFFEANFSDVLPRPFQEFYIGNSFRWDNTFQNTQTLNFAIGARWKGFRLRTELSTIDNFVYLTRTDFTNPAKHPTFFAQADKSFSVFKTTLEKTFRFWKILALDTRLVYQQSSVEMIMQFPKFSTRSALYFDFDLLGTTPVQIGVEGYYNTPYHSRFYNPALGSFYNQNQLEIGGFAFVDAFLNLRVKRANVFFKMSNLGADFLGYNYMMTNGYPIPARAFAFGVLWRFYD